MDTPAYIESLTRRCRHQMARLGLATLLACCASTTALAALGQAPTQLAHAADPVSGTTGTPTVRRLAQRSTAAAGYALRETVLDTGTTVQELVRPDGVVFAVLWSGPVLPDLSTLLGSYDSDFDAHLRQRRAQQLRGGTVAFSGARLVLRSSGRMRDFSGHAYAPALVPAGVRMQDLLP